MIRESRKADVQRVISGGTSSFLAVRRRKRNCFEIVATIDRKLDLFKELGRAKASTEFPASPPLRSARAARDPNGPRGASVYVSSPAAGGAYLRTCRDKGKQSPTAGVRLPAPDQRLQLIRIIPGLSSPRGFARPPQRGVGSVVGLHYRAHFVRPIPVSGKTTRLPVAASSTRLTNARQLDRLGILPAPQGTAVGAEQPHPSAPDPSSEGKSAISPAFHM